MPVRVFAVIPAAGYSRRMGGDKQLLAIGGRPMLAVVVETVRAACVAGVVVVTRQAIASRLSGTSPELSEAFRSGESPAGNNDGPMDGAAPVRISFNDDPRSEMVDSVRIGITRLGACDSIGPGDGVLVCPSDHPGITTADLDACIAAFNADPGRIVIATRDGRRGHPIVFPAGMAAFVQSAVCDAGLNALPRAYPELVTTVECRSAGVSEDVDTRKDYDEAAGRDAAD